MPERAFSHVSHWVFDLDNTLYPPHVRLFDQIEVKMRSFVMQALGVSFETADHLRTQYWHTHGTTLAGLMREHQIEPDPFLEDVHDINFDALPRDPELADLLCALPGRRIIYTNGTAPYARRVLEARGLSGIFHEIYGVEHANYLPKPEAAAFEVVFGREELIGTQAAMFEDEARNLKVPHAMGLRTVHVAPEPVQPPQTHVDFHTADLNAFLKTMLGAKNA